MFAADSDDEAPPRTGLARRSRSRSQPRRTADLRLRGLPAHGGLAASRTAAAVGASSLELEEPGARSIQWHSWLQDYVLPARQRWGRQLRKLVTESMFTGMNPHAWSFAQGGLDIDDRIGAEQKEHARAFMQKNRVLPKQCYKEAEEMMAAGLAPSQPGYVRADLFVAGFPCQPYSSQSRKSWTQPNTNTSGPRC